ncbi:REC8 meiotic recombination protein b isoform X1 [Hippoglossus stenolepis]|uniref:REC8 meiotic recombination protein b isoform X1 n=1 Tax=Hippoglossus stenolepis TaxID=195615 RepID=UPI00159CA845|nr:REC8 meiotic recombination protein b isoform X1 [Hippoglossus stenolepis]
MFYYPNVLHRHTGCFSTIWLAATRGTRVTRRELLKVNVKLTCGDILGYVTAQVPPSQPNLPMPRFSLYLSSQLQYGVVVVYHSQCRFLLEEIQQTIDRLLRAKRCSRIDMAESDRLALNVPDSLYLMEEAEGAQDPFFGLMESDQLLSPYKILQTAFTSEAVGSQHSLVPRPRTTLDNEGFRSPSVAITLREKEQFVITTAENFEGEDLPEVTDREIDLLMDQNDQFCKEVEQQRSRERTRELEGTMSSFDQLNKTAVRGERDSVFLLDEESGQTVDVTLAPHGLEMTPLRVAMPTPTSGASRTEGDQETEHSNEEIRVCPIRKPAGSRRRQLIFADPQVQISDRAMKEQIVKPLAETLDLSSVLLNLTKWATPAQLFSAPCESLPHADLQLLWQQCALLTALPVHGKNQSGEMGEEEEARGESEQEQEILRHSSMKQISSESGLQPADGSSVLDVILDISREDKSVSDVITPVGRWSPQEDTRLLMEPIAEENIEMPEAQTDTESRDMLSWISSVLQRFTEVTFDSLLPPEADRTTAAHTLYKLLELLSARHVTVLQTEPYSNMTISSA